MHQIINTTRTSYLCESSEEAGGKLVLKGAISFEEVTKARTLAKMYIKAKLLGNLKTIRVSSANVESTEEDQEISTLIGVYINSIPEAENRAKAKATLQALGELLDVEIDDDDDEDDD